MSGTPELADRYLTNPAEVSVTPTATTVKRIEQGVTMVNQSEKTALLALYLQDPAVERALVFSRTKHGADKIVRMLEAAGIASAAIHGNKSQAREFIRRLAMDEIPARSQRGCVGGRNPFRETIPVKNLLWEWLRKWEEGGSHFPLDIRRSVQLMNQPRELGNPAQSSFNGAL